MKHLTKGGVAGLLFLAMGANAASAGDSEGYAMGYSEARERSPIACEALARWLRKSSGAVRQAASQIIPGSDAGVSHCQVDILFGAKPKQNINIRVGLPLNSVDGGTGGVEGAWNGRTQGIGGGGCSGNLNVTGPVNAGYVGSGNDTGHTGGDCEPGVNENGTYNYRFINDFIRNGMKAQVLYMKSVAQRYYGKKPDYNYWNGCSTGGRQGYVVAQELGKELDGILANAPAMYWTRFQTTQMWGQIVMKDLVGGPIDEAKLSQATTSAVAACDAKDGVVDGVIDDPRTCSFSATRNICGKPSAPGENCLTVAEAEAVDKIWDGPRNQRGNKIWFGLERGAQLGGFFSLNGPVPFALGVIQFHWDMRDRNFDWTTVAMDEYPTVAQAGSRRIADITDTFGGLDKFKRSGGKLLTMVGMNDQLIMPRGVINYYREMASRYDTGRGVKLYPGGTDIDFRKIQRFYRLFRAPGVAHCAGGVGPQPQGLFQALVDWVENGNAPEEVLAVKAIDGEVISSRPLCPYPQTAIYDGRSDPDDFGSYTCGGNLETPRTVCNDVLVKYKREVNGALDYSDTGVGRKVCSRFN